MMILKASAEFFQSNFEKCSLVSPLITLYKAVLTFVYVNVENLQ